MEYTIKNIRQIRKERNETQEQFAESLGVSVNSIRNWESGDYIPPMDKIQTICDTLGCDIDFLFGIIPQKTYLLTDFANKTGLSSDAINALCEMEPNKIENLSYLLANNRFQEMLGRLSTFATLSKIEVTAADKGNSKKAYAALDDQMLEMFKMEFLFREFVRDFQSYKLHGLEVDKNDD